MSRIIVAVAVAGALALPLSASPSSEPRTLFDFSCATQAVFRAAQLSTAARAALAQLSGQGVHAWGDRAVRSLTSGGDTYFVPLTCGATGNCIWGVFGGTPLHDLGRVYADIIRISTDDQGQPVVLAYEHMSAMDGSLSSYLQRNGVYVRKSQRSVTTEEVVQTFGCDQRARPCCS